VLAGRKVLINFGVAEVDLHEAWRNQATPC
jgi:hypothetical protein